MRTLKELYSLLLDENLHHHSGMCAAVHCLFTFDTISTREYRKLITDIKLDTDKMHNGRRNFMFDPYNWELRIEWIINKLTTL